MVMCDGRIVRGTARTEEGYPRENIMAGDPTLVAVFCENDPNWPWARRRLGGPSPIKIGPEILLIGFPTRSDVALGSIKGPATWRLLWHNLPRK